MITLYGVSQSRAFRCLWMLEELGLEFEHVLISFIGGGTRPPGFLAGDRFSVADLGVESPA